MALAVHAAKKLHSDELYLTSFGATRLTMEPYHVPLRRGEHVDVNQLVEGVARYLNVPRLKEPSVLLQVMSDGGEPAGLGAGQLCLSRRIKCRNGSLSGSTRGADADLGRQPSVGGLGETRCCRASDGCRAPDGSGAGESWTLPRRRGQADGGHARESCRTLKFASQRFEQKKPITRLRTRRHRREATEIMLVDETVNQIVSQQHQFL